ncbi:ABC transporter ATP-binding protein [Lachnospiraceae bacterium 42-17]|nr:ABC transporter ATP-binding protein [Dorea sp.]
MGKILELKNIKKSFGSVKAISNGQFNLLEGEVHSVIGENGAGKSTLMKILGGVYAPDEGSIIYNDREYSSLSTKEALELGIGIVHQEFMLINEMTVLENIILGKEPKKSVSRIDFHTAKEEMKTFTEEYGFDVRLNKKVIDIPVGEAQRVEIVKTLYRGAKIMILDEPTAVLTPQESEKLFSVIRKLKESGTSIIFISHKLQEVMEISDRITIMRAGEFIATVNKSETNKGELAKMMLGRDLFHDTNREKTSPGEVCLLAENIFVPGERELSKIRDLSFEIRKGEILGVAGVDGNGQKEFTEALIGLRPVEAGKILFHNQDITNLSVKERRKLKIGYIPEDRNSTGLLRDGSIIDNLIALKINFKDMVKNGIINAANAESFADDAMEKFDIRPRKKRHICRRLSGGNAQKVVIARELSQSPELLIACQPTRGVDIGSIDAIHELLREARDEGASILMISTDLEEVLALSDRILVLYEGRIAGIVEADKTDEEELGLLMMGGVRS